MTMDRKEKTRFFIGAEGEGEQSFVKWIQQLCDKQGLSVYLDCKNLAGGGYSSLVKKAAIHRDQRLEKGVYKACFLFADTDRSTTGDWTLERFRSEAAAKDLVLCCQHPKLEALFVRLHPGKESATIPTTAAASQQLQTLWATYEKPADAFTLARRFSLDDLLRAAGAQPELKEFLKTIGLMA